MAEAEQVTSTICRRIEALKCGLNSAEIGIRPLVVERTDENNHLRCRASRHNTLRQNLVSEDNDITLVDK